MAVELPTGTVTLVFTDIEGSTLADDFPPPRSLPTPSNLPTVPTSFVGRDTKLAGGPAMTFDQVLDHAAAWAEQRSRGTT